MCLVFDFLSLESVYTLHINIMISARILTLSLWSTTQPYLRREVPGMPKKFQGENSKSATAKARKAEAKAVDDARKQKELEDALWQIMTNMSWRKSRGGYA